MPKIDVAHFDEARASVCSTLRYYRTGSPDLDLSPKITENEFVIEVDEDAVSYTRPKVLAKDRSSMKSLKLRQREKLQAKRDQVSSSSFVFNEVIQSRSSK